jgi:hypothetical protein
VLSANNIHFTTTVTYISVEREGQNTTVGGKVFNVQMTCFGPSSGPSSGLKNA